MEQKKIKTLLLAGVITLAGMFAGCTEYADDPAEFTTENIVINYTDSVIDASISSGSRTRSVSESTEIGSSVLTSKTGKKMYLSCTEAPWPVEKAAVTRGAKVTTVGISSMGVSASVYGSSSSYTSAGCGSYFYKESVSSGTPTRFYWPTSDYKISFFGYYPYNNAAFTVQSSASTTGTPTYSYTVPSAIASQQDIMTGQVVDRLGGSASAVNITLSHRCAAIRFSITNDRSEAITMNTISIEGVKYTGTFNENTWTLGDAVNSSLSNPFTLSYGSSIAAGATVDVTGTTNIFLMLPQTLPATASLKVVVDDEEFETELAGTWQAGKEYIYSVTINDNAIDLSMVDNAGNARASMTTANCYMVHDAGDYKIPLVYGNAIKNGNANSTSYAGVSGQLYPFVNHAGTGINGPWITKSTSGTGVNKGMGVTVNGAELLWQDASGLILAVGIDGDYLTFTVPAAASSKAGNALIAAKSGSTIVWSWHIWVTTETLASTTSIATGSHTYRVAPVNLGWVPTGGGGKQGYCPYYQWGRKDPFIPAAAYNSTTNHTVYNISNSSVTGLTYQASTAATIADNIKNPTTHYYNSSNYGPCNTTYYNMWDAQNASTNNVATATKKTIYDPCPPGFCVPTGNLWYYFGGNANPTGMNSRSDSNWDSTNKGKTWTLNGASIYFPAAGFRDMSLTSLSNVGSRGYYWSATPDGADYGRGLGFHPGYWNWNNYYRAFGFSVRPVAEE
jgi:hypothetical protein